MRLFWDTNIILDLLGERVPFYESAAKIATLADERKLSITVSTLSYSTVFYVLKKYENTETVKDKLRKFKIISSICAMDEEIIDKGLNSDFKDFEDALQYFCALKSNCDVLITRNSADFKTAQIPIMTTEQYLASLNTN
jgi:predicted nucleic acid-binding protein